MTIRRVTMTPSNCPYGAGDCPKVEYVEESVKDLIIQVRRMNMYLMVVIGILTAEFGVCIL